MAARFGKMTNEGDKEERSANKCQYVYAKGLFGVLWSAARHTAFKKPSIDESSQ